MVRQRFIYSYFVVSLFFGLTIKPSHQWNDNYTGVYLVPYPKNSLTDYTSYTFGEVEVMIEVISQRFSNIITNGAGSQNVPFIPNVTYYESAASVYTAEAAARLNLRLNKTMRVFQEIQIKPRTDTEINLALECTHKANTIFLGTVKDLVISSGDGDGDILFDQTWTRAAVDTLLELSHRRRNDVRLEGIKIGTRMQCDDLPLNDKKTATQLSRWGRFEEILSHSDFLICRLPPTLSHIAKGPAKAFEATVDLIQRIREAIKSFNQVELMAEVSWASGGTEPWEKLENMKVFWEAAMEWARNNKFRMWFFEAIDNPDYHGKLYGWWRLTNNSKSYDVSGYVEKITEIEKHEVSNVGTVISIAVGLVIISILSICIVYLVVRNKKLQEQLSKEDIEEFVHGEPSSDIQEEQNDPSTVDNYALRCPYDYSYEMDIDQLNIQMDRLLGAGEFGSVYQATLNRGIDEVELVALKIPTAKCSRAGLKGLLCEIKIMIYLGKHENIVELKGAYTAELDKGIVYVATELCSSGSLQNYLRKRMYMPLKFTPVYENSPVCRSYDDMKRLLNFQQMLRWADEIASGMEYLAIKKVVHADLATRNVLLTAAKTAKICDFGLSRRMYNYLNYTTSEQEPLPWRWMALETLKWGEYSCRSDIWSYGVLLWEICTLGDMPFPELSWNADFVAKLSAGMRLGSPKDGIPKLYKVMVNCWHREPDERPSFTQIKQSIKEITDTI